MTTPSAVRAAMILSLASTGGALYYFLSDGGDPEKLDHNLAEATAKLAETRAKIAETSTKLVGSTTRLKETVTDWTSTSNIVEQVSTSPTSGTEMHQADTKKKQNSTDEATYNTEESKDYHRKDNSKCHTCSGPRIWFFAEKLRLKRRITPYPDPP